MRRNYRLDDMSRDDLIELIYQKESSITREKGIVKKLGRKLDKLKECQYGDRTLQLPLDIGDRSRTLRFICIGLKNAIDDHGPIDKGWKSSAAKRVYQMLNHLVALQTREAVHPEEKGE